MVDVLLIVCLIISFLTGYYLTKWWIKKAHANGLVGKDVHKRKVKVAEFGGLPVVIAYIFSVLLYIGYRTFILGTDKFVSEILGVIATLSLITIIGFADDLFGWKVGLKQWQKPILCLFAALPLMMINAGKSSIVLPLIGRLELGIIYPIIFIPVIVSGAANAFNMLAGYNGLEAGMGILILSGLGVVVWVTQGLGVVAVLAGAMIMALMAFLVFNHYPAKIFGGDTLTYSVGAMIAIVAILGNAEKLAALFFIPYFAEFVLKLRGKFRKESFAKLRKDGGLDVPYDRIYGLEHLVIKFLRKRKEKVSELNVVYTLWFIQFFFVVLGLFIEFVI